MQPMRANPQRRLASLALRCPGQAAVLSAMQYLVKLPVERRVKLLQRFRLLARAVDESAGKLPTERTTGIKAHGESLEVRACGGLAGTPLSVSRGHELDGGDDGSDKTALQHVVLSAQGSVVARWLASCVLLTLDDGTHCVFDFEAAVRGVPQRRWVVAGDCVSRGVSIRLVSAGVLFGVSPSPPAPAPAKVVVEQPAAWLLENTPAPDAIHSVTVDIGHTVRQARFPARALQASLAMLVCAPAAAAYEARALKAVHELEAQYTQWERMFRGHGAQVPAMFATANEALKCCQLRNKFSAFIDGQKEQQRQQQHAHHPHPHPHRQRAAGPPSNPDLLLLLRAHEAAAGATAHCRLPDCLGFQAAVKLRQFRTAVEQLHLVCKAHTRDVVQALLVQGTFATPDATTDTDGMPPARHPAPQDVLSRVIISSDGGGHGHAETIAAACRHGCALLRTKAGVRRAAAYGTGVCDQEVAVEAALECVWRCAALTHGDALQEHPYMDTDSAAALHAVTANAAADPLYARMVAGQVGVCDATDAQSVVVCTLRLDAALRAVREQAAHAMDTFLGTETNRRRFDYAAALRMLDCLTAAIGAAKAVAAAAASMYRQLNASACQHLEDVCLRAAKPLDDVEQQHVRTVCPMVSMATRKVYAAQAGSSTGAGAGINDDAGVLRAHACYEQCPAVGTGEPRRVVCCDAQCVFGRTRQAGVAAPSWLAEATTGTAAAGAGSGTDGAAAAELRARILAFVLSTPRLLDTDTVGAWMAKYVCPECSDDDSVAGGCAAYASSTLLKCRRCSAPVTREQEVSHAELCGNCSAVNSLVWDMDVGEVTCRSCGVVLLDCLQDDSPDREFVDKEDDHMQVVRTGGPHNHYMSSLYNLRTDVVSYSASGENCGRQRRVLHARMRAVDAIAAASTGRRLRSSTTMGERDTDMLHVIAFVQRVVVEEWGLPKTAQDRVLNWFHMVRTRDRVLAARLVLYGAMVVAYLEWHRANVFDALGAECPHCSMLIKTPFMSHVLACAKAKATAKRQQQQRLPPSTPIFASAPEPVMCSAGIALPPTLEQTPTAPAAPTVPASPTAVRQPAPKRRLRARGDTLDFGDMAFLSTIDTTTSTTRSAKPAAPAPAPAPAPAHAFAPVEASSGHRLVLSPVMFLTAEERSKLLE